MIEAAARAVAGLGLAPQAGEALVLDGPTEHALLASAEQWNLRALVRPAADAGVIALSEAGLEEADQLQRAALSAAVELDACLVEVGRCLRSAGIPFRALKGAALAHLDELDPAWRGYGDVDVLVPSQHLDDAVRVVGELGFRPLVEPIGRRWAARFAKSVTLRRPDRFEVDLHRMLAAGPFGWRVREACLFERGEAFAVGGDPFVALDPVHRFFHACYHARLGGLETVRHARDIAMTARRVDRSTLAAEVSDGWSLGLVASALEWAAATLGSVLDPAWLEWASHHPLDDKERALVGAYGGSFSRLARQEVRALRNPLDRVRYVTGLLLPSRAHLASRGQGRWNRLRRVAEKAA